MLPGVEGPLASATDPCPTSSRSLRRRSLANLLRMGHCAPTVMKTILDSCQADAPWLVKLTAGLPGGIGNTRNECGGITAPLVLLGLRYARDPDVAGVPLVVHKGRALLQAFHHRHGTISCRDILGDARLPLPCVGVVRIAPERYLEVRSRDCIGALSGECRQACAILHAHHLERGFHCAHAVLRHAHDAEAVDPALLDATAAFVGGTVHAGLTCSALTAGVMLLGLGLGEIEDSPRRVLRVIGVMAAGGDAFADHLNAFNRVMNLGHELAHWFEGRYGSTQCRDITGCDFSTVAGARQHAERGGVVRCGGIAREVALRVRGMVQHPRAGPGSLEAPSGQGTAPRGWGVSRSGSNAGPLFETIRLPLIHVTP